MTGFDHAQSPRLGQRVPYEGTTVMMFSGVDLPEVSVTGQIIYRTDTQGLQVYNGEAWEDVVGGVAGLLTFVGPEPPVAQSIGDLWFDSNDGNHPYRAAATGTGSWTSLRDGSIAFAQATADGAASDAADALAQSAEANTTAMAAASAAATAQSTATDAMTAAEAAQATADGAIRTYYQSTPPWANGTGGHADDAGDMWFDTDDGQAYRWNDSTLTWQVIEDNSIAAALSAAQDAQTTADGKITAYYADTAPTSAEIGDLWYDTNNGNKVNYCTAVGPVVWSDLPTGIDGLDTTTVTAGNLGGTTPETLPTDLGGNMDDAVITGATIQTVDAPNQGIKLQDGTLKAYPPEGGTAFFDVDPAAGMVIVAGEGTFESLNTKNSTELGGTTTLPVGSSIQMAAGVQPPGSAPKVDTTYDTLQFDEGSGWEWRQGFVTDGTYWYTATNGANFTEMERFDYSGNHAGYGWSQQSYVTCGLAYHSGKIYQLIQALDANDNRMADQYFVLRHATSTFTNDGTYAWSNSVGTKNPAIGVDHATGEIVIAQHRDGNDDKLRMRWYSVPSGSGGGLTATGTTDTTLEYNYNLGGLLFGSFDFGFGGGIQAWVTSSWGTGTYRAIASNTGDESPTRSWESGMPNKVGFEYPTSGTYANKFVSMDQTGLMRIYTQLDYYATMGDTANTRWVSSTNFRDQTTDWETPQSNRASIIPKKRSKIVVTTAPLPASPGTNDPNQVQIYIGKNATDPGRTAMYRQTTPAVGVTTASYATLATSGNIPPDTNNFPEAAAAKIVSTSKRSDQITPVTTIPAVGAVNLDGLIPPGTITMYAGSTAPPGWALCNGATKSRTTDKQLFDNIGTAFGVGDGSTTFNLPNLQGKFPLGAGTTQPSATSRALGTSGGADELTAAMLPNHTHGAGTLTINSTGSAHTHEVQRGTSTGGSTGRAAQGNTTAAANMPSETTGSGHTHGITGDTGTGGGLDNDPVLPPYVAINFIIKL